MKKELIIYGPFDRFNYGDLLFPHMLEYVFNKLYPNEFTFENFSLVAIDLKEKGGVESANYEDFIEAVNSNKEAIIIVAGGQCLTSKWDNLYSYISSSYNSARQIPIFGKLLRKTSYARKKLNGLSEYPFVIDKTNFNTSVKVLYNCVGGGSEKTKINKRLIKSDYVSVREQHSFDNLKKSEVPVKMVPDCAIIMSDIYPKEKFITHSAIRKNLYPFLSVDKKYIFVQVSKYKHQNAIDAIVKQLDNLALQHNLELVLCPIGTAGGHEDHIPLQEIFTKLHTVKKHFIENPHVLEIMALIANANLYIGTSLHGVITAMTYGLPYVGLNKKQVKVQQYMKTWGVDGLSSIQNPQSFIDYANEVIDIPSPLILSKSSEKKQHYYTHVKEMYKTIEG
jgi:hypothetical protein